MEDLLSKIFDKIAFYENDGIQFGIEYDAQVEELLSLILSIVLRKFSFILNRLDYLIPGWAFPVKDAPATCLSLTGNGQTGIVR